MSTEDDIRLVRDVVRGRFLAGWSNDVIAALEGFKWLLGEETAWTREQLLKERQFWEEEGA